VPALVVLAKLLVALAVTLGASPAPAAALPVLIAVTSGTASISARSSSSLTPLSRFLRIGLFSPSPSMSALVPLSALDESCAHCASSVLRGSG